MKQKIQLIPSYIKGGIRNIRQDISQMRGTNIWIFIMYGIMFDLVNNLWRPFAVKFLERLGGTEFEIALLSALPGLVAAIVLLPGAIIFRRFTNQKRATGAFILISRAMLLLIALVPTLPATVQPVLFVILVAIMNCPDALSQTSLQNFLGLVFGGQTRGQAIAIRTKVGQALIPVVTMTSGLIITFVPSTDAQRIFLYQVFFVGAFLLGVIEVLIFNRFKVPEYAKAPEKTSGANDDKQAQRPSFTGIFKDKRFRAFFIPTIAFAFTWQAGWPLVNMYLVIDLSATEMWLAIFALVSGITAFFSGVFWQGLLRKKGNSTAFVVAASLLAANLFVFPLVPSLPIMAVVHIFSGFSAIGINTVLLNGVLEATPDENRMTYLAFFNTLMNISLFIAPFFAYFLLRYMGVQAAMFSVGGMRVVGTLFIWLGYRFATRGNVQSQS